MGIGTIKIKKGGNILCHGYLYELKLKITISGKLYFGEDSSNRKEMMGSKGGYLFGNADDTNEVIILLEVEDLEKSRQFMQSEDLKDAVERSGAIGQPDIVIIDDEEKITV